MLELHQIRFHKKNVAFQRVTPHIHQRNADDSAIQTWKNHSIAGLSSADTYLPLSEWDHLTKKCNITINLLCSSLRKPKLSAYARLLGNFDFNQNPLAVPSTKVVIYETPQKLSTFPPHGLEVYYIGPSLEN